VGFNHCGQPAGEGNGLKTVFSKKCHFRVIHLAAEEKTILWPAHGQILTLNLNLKDAIVSSIKGHTIFKTARRRPGRTPLPQGGFEVPQWPGFSRFAMRAALEFFEILFNYVDSFSRADK
jgi:hypothetical protein